MRFRRFFITIRLFFKYMFFSFPKLRVFIDRYNEISKLKSEAHLASNKEMKKYYEGQLDIIKEILDNFLEFKDGG